STARFVRLVMKVMLVIPEAAASSAIYCIVGVSARGNISFGTALVAGSTRVPRPAAVITAFVMGIVMSPSVPAGPAGYVEYVEYVEYTGCLGRLWPRLVLVLGLVPRYIEPVAHLAHVRPTHCMADALHTLRAAPCTVKHTAQETERSRATVLLPSRHDMLGLAL